jgi:hypothetical protein
MYKNACFSAIAVTPKQALLDVFILLSGKRALAYASVPSASSFNCHRRVGMPRMRRCIANWLPPGMSQPFALKTVDEEESRMARLYAGGKIIENIWDNL